MRKVLLILLVLFISINTFQWVRLIIRHQTYKDQFQPGNLGDQFKGLELVLKNVPRVGYYTDKDIEEPLAIAQFQQAQYVLAPTILDLNNIYYPYVIIDCTTPEIALEKVNALGLEPLKANDLGVILAFNPKAQNLKP